MAFLAPLGIALAGGAAGALGGRAANKISDLIGLKKGEKLSEELTLGKNLKKTKHSYIMECNENIKFKNVDKNLKKIENLMINNKINFIKKLI